MLGGGEPNPVTLIYPLFGNPIRLFKEKKVGEVALRWIKRMPEGKDVWQNDLLESRARSRGDVIFSEGGGAGFKTRHEDKFSM